MENNQKKESKEGSSKDEINKAVNAIHEDIKKEILDEFFSRKARDIVEVIFTDSDFTIDEGRVEFSLKLSTLIKDALDSGKEVKIHMAEDEKVIIILG